MRILHRTPHQIHTGALDPQRTRFAAWLCSLTLLLSSEFCLATPCSQQTEAPEAVPPLEELDPEFQPHIYDSNDITVMYRIRYTPPGYDPNGSTKYPTVISIPPTVFRQGEAAGGTIAAPRQQSAGGGGLSGFSSGTSPRAHGLARGSTHT